MPKLKRKDLAQHFKGVNPLTPNIIEYGQTDNYIYELSQGRGFDGPEMYGVTVKNKDGTDPGLSQGGFKTERAARMYIDEIK